MGAWCGPWGVEREDKKGGWVEGGDVLVKFFIGSDLLDGGHGRGGVAGYGGVTRVSVKLWLLVYRIRGAVA